MGDDKGRQRPKYLKLGQGAHVGAPAGDNDTASDGAPAFTVTRGELAAMVRQAVASALEAIGARPPALLDREDLAAALGCSSSLVDKLRRGGMPCVRLGDSPRFELAACLSWIRKDGAA